MSVTDNSPEQAYCALPPSVLVCEKPLTYGPEPSAQQPKPSNVCRSPASPTSRRLTVRCLLVYRLPGVHSRVLFPTQLTMEGFEVRVI